MLPRRWVEPERVAHCGQENALSRAFEQKSNTSVERDKVARLVAVSYWDEVEGAKYHRVPGRKVQRVHPLDKLGRVRVNIWAE